MLQHLLIGIGGVVALAVAWVFVQEWVRRETPGTAPDCDMLQHLAHHCHGCAHEGECAAHDAGPDGCAGNA